MSAHNVVQKTYMMSLSVYDNIRISILFLWGENDLCNGVEGLLMYGTK